MHKIKIDLDIGIQTIEKNGKTYKIIIETIDEGYCICGCGEKAKTKSMYFNAACRQRVSRRRKKEQENSKSNK